MLKTSLLAASPWSQPLLHHCRYILFHSLRQLLLLQLLLLSINLQHVLANPVSNPEIITKSGKISTTSQQQQQQQKLNPQDAHLNSLAAYATNYDSISNGNAYKNFKPSYKIPDMETNFTPIQAVSANNAAATPMLMQYLPQSIHESGGGIQYLQLIPTRQLIVPINSYNAVPQPTSTMGVLPYYPTLSAGNSVVDYGEHSTAMLSPAAPVNTDVPSYTTLVDVPNNFPYGIQNYANTIQPYKNNYRINREIKEKQISGPLNFSLNLNEYIPGPNDPSVSHSYIRGRP